MRVKVWNDNKHDLKTYFKGDDLVIPAGKWKEMDFYDAHELKGTYHPIHLLADGTQDPKSMQILRIESMDAKKEEPKVEAHVCMQCKHSSPSPEELEAHIKVRHAEAVRTEIPELDEEIKRRGRPKKTA